MSNFKKFLLVLVGLLVVSGILFGITFFTVRPAATPTDQSITLDGTIACLPHVGGGPQTTECALGLKDDNGEYYGLKRLPDPTIPTQTNVEITGTLSPASDNEVYDIVGTITISSLKKL